MDRSLLLKILTGNNQVTGAENLSSHNNVPSAQQGGAPMLVGYYDFKKYSGIYTFNEKYVNPTGEAIDDSGNVISDTYPLYSLCNVDDINKISGSGYFDQQSIVQVGTNFPYKGWTFIFDYESKDFTGNYNIGRTLISSMDSSSATSGFNIGINGANKPYFQYPDTGNNLRTITLHQVEMSERNTLSIAKTTSSLVQMVHHDTLYDKKTTGTFTLEDITTSAGVDKTYSNKLYIGDFYSSSAGYTGFSGYMDHLVVYGDYMIENAVNEVAEGFVSSGYLPKRFESVEVVNNAITQITHSVSGVTGQGITGYANIASGAISAKCGPDIVLYAQSGLTGDKTGAVVTITQGTEKITGTTLVEREPSLLHDESLLLRYARPNLSQRLHGPDLSEIYNYSTIHSGLNLKAAPYMGVKYFELEEAHRNQPINFYVNGLYKDSGILSGETTIISGEYHVSGTNKEKVVFENDISYLGSPYSNTFDIITGEVHITGFESGDVSVDWDSIEERNGKDVYLNGLKLFSGVEYYEGGNDHVYIRRNEILPQYSGQVAFVPRKSMTEIIKSSGSSSIEAPSSGYVSEQYWRNGQRQIRHDDYLLISEKSLLNETGTVKYSNRNPIYNGEINGFY
tara:strand:+ start:2332 stop:4200 length:1869 start_codon:yes stop_codon:yes gene_type:complete